MSCMNKGAVASQNTAKVFIMTDVHSDEMPTEQAKHDEKGDKPPVSVVVKVEPSDWLLLSDNDSESSDKSDDVNLDRPDSSASSNSNDKPESVVVKVEPSDCLPKSDNDCEKDGKSSDGNEDKSQSPIPYKGDGNLAIIKDKVDIALTEQMQVASESGISKRPFKLVGGESETGVEDNNKSSYSNNPTLNCEACGITCTSLLLLNNHKRRCRAPAKLLTEDLDAFSKICDGRKTYFCHICQYSTVRKLKMRQHVVTHNHLDRHKGTPYQCPECSYSCKLLGNFKRHLTSHTGVKAFACNECNYRSAYSTHLKRHMRIHSREEVYKCTECDYKSADSGNLKRHLRIHTDPTFNCEACGITYTSLELLDNHKKRCRGKAASPTKLVTVDEIPYDLDVLSKMCDGRKTYFCHICEYNTIKKPRI